jgi:ribosome biogenesis GTPase A
MQIQWYPGHMNKAGKEILEVMPQVDLIIEILDARLPFSSENPFLKTLRGDKPCIKLLSKCDLADPERTSEWQSYLEREHNVKTLATTIEQSDKMRNITDLCHKMLPEKAASDKLLHALIMGIPNVGKSTLINILAGRMIAKTGNEPAITKMLQRINIGNNVILLDTPGMLWPNIENQNSGYRLAVTGAVKDTAIKHDDVAFFAVEFMLKHYPELLKTRFQLTELPEQEQTFFDIIGKQRGCLGPGGHIDMDRIAKILLSEFREGTIGRMTMETPAMMEQELAELVIIRAEKEERQRLRKLQRKRS